MQSCERDKFFPLAETSCNWGKSSVIYLSIKTTLNVSAITINDKFFR